MSEVSLAEIAAKTDELQTALDAEQQQVKDLLAQKDATIAGLNDTITTLQGLVAAGGTPEERQALLDKLTSIKTDLEGTVAPEAAADVPVVDSPQPAVVDNGQVPG